MTMRQMQALVRVRLPTTNQGEIHKAYPGSVMMYFVSVIALPGKICYTM